MPGLKPWLQIVACSATEGCAITSFTNFKKRIVTSEAMQHGNNSWTSHSLTMHNRSQVRSQEHEGVVKLGIHSSNVQDDVQRLTHKYRLK